VIRGLGTRALKIRGGVRKEGGLGEVGKGVEQSFLFRVVCLPCTLVRVCTCNKMNLQSTVIQSIGKGKEKQVSIHVYGYVRYVCGYAIHMYGCIFKMHLCMQCVCARARARECMCVCVCACVCVWV